MGRVTEENMRRLENSSTYEEAGLEEMNPNTFSEELNELITKKNIPVQKIVDISGASKSYVNKLRSLKGQKVQPSRPYILKLGLALELSIDEINQLLKAAHYQELYSRNTVDSVILWGLMHNLSGSQIRTKLEEKNVGEELLK